MAVVNLRQPQGRVAPNRKHPLAQKLAFLWSASAPAYELLSTTLRTTDNTAKTASPIGKVINASAGQVNIEWSREFIKTSTGDGYGDFTLAVYANPATGGALEALFAQKNDAGGSPYAQAGIYANADASGTAQSGTISFFTYNSTGASTGVQASGQLDGAYHWWVGARRGTTYTLYRDGVVISGAPVGTGAAQQIIQTSPQRYTAIGGQGNTTSGAYTRQAAMAAGWNRAISATEAAVNPWQLLEAANSFPYAALASSSAVLLAAIAEAGSAADASSAVVISAAAAVEAGSAADASQAASSTSAATAEVGAGVDATVCAISTAAASAEVLTTAESISKGAATSAGITESGAAGETSGALNAALANIAEAGVVIDLLSAVAALSAGLVDAMSAADASSTSGAATSVSTAEAGSAADATSGAQLNVAATSESGAVSDSAAATTVTTAGRSDALTAADLQQPGGTIISASVAESGAVADFVLASYILAAQVTEGASVSDWLASSLMGVASISESSPAIDVTSGRWITSAAVIEALAALEQTTAQLGGQLKPNPHRTYVGRARIRSITGAARIRSM